MLGIVYCEKISKRFFFFLKNSTIQSKFENEIVFIFQNERIMEKVETNIIFKNLFYFFQKTFIQSNLKII